MTKNHFARRKELQKWLFRIFLSLSLFKKEVSKAEENEKCKKSNSKSVMIIFYPFFFYSLLPFFAGIVQKISFFENN
jgi:hypothetical protein